MKAKLLLTALLLGASFTATQAQNVALATWDLTTTSTKLSSTLPANVSPWAPTANDPNVTVGGLTYGPGISAITSAAVTGWGATGWNYTDGTTAANQTAATAADNGKYVTFSITATAGNSISLSSVSPYNVRTSPSNGLFPSNGQWQYSLDGTNFINIGTTVSWPIIGPTAGTNSPAVDLSIIHDLQGVAAGTTVTIRLLLWKGIGSGYWCFYGGTSPNKALIINGTTAVALPLDLISFSGEKGNGANRLDWVTAHEKNVNRFDIERSNDGVSYNKIGETATKGNETAQGNKYTYSDQQTDNQTAYYRLKIVDVDGSYKYSNTVVIYNTALASTVRLYPNPTGNTLYLEGLQTNVTYSISNAIGTSIVAVTPLTTTSGTKAAINTSALMPGIYFLHLSNVNGSTETLRFIKE